MKKLRAIQLFGILVFVAMALQQMGFREALLWLCIFEFAYDKFENE
jgi:hypothetical protein